MKIGESQQRVCEKGKKRTMSYEHIVANDHFSGRNGLQNLPLGSSNNAMQACVKLNTRNRAPLGTCNVSIKYR